MHRKLSSSSMNPSAELHWKKGRLQIAHATPVACKRINKLTVLSLTGDAAKGKGKGEEAETVSQPK
jgi:hypothetical protein